MKSLFAIIIVGIITACLFFFLDQESVNVVQAVQENAKSQDLKSRIKLQDGTVHYELVGDEADPLVVLVHGVSGPMIVWDKVVPELLKAHFRVLRFDWYGRGFSDRPEVRYDLELYIRQLEQILSALKLGSPFNLVGHSMGAIISSEFTSRYPARVRKLALVGPAGFELEASPLAKLIQLPVLGDFLMATQGDKSLKEHNRKYFYHPERFEEFQFRFASQLRIEGSKRAILSTYRNVPLQNYLDGYRRLGEMKRRILVVWGVQDVSFPYSNHVALLQAVPLAGLVSIEAAAHLPQYEQADQVNRALIPYLKEN